jgi:hypothetical protein
MGNRRVYQCPFYKKGCKDGICCEIGKIFFPDDVTARYHIFAFCTNEIAWRSCSIALSLQKYYDRKDQNNGKSSEAAQRKRALKKSE